MAQKRKRNKKWLYWLLMLFLLVGAIVVVYLVWNNYFNDKGQDDEGEVQEQTIVEEKVEDVKKEKSTEVKVEDEKRPIQYEGDDPNTKEELSGSVIRAERIDDIIIVRVNIDQFLSNGKCELNIVNNNETIYSDVVNIVSVASTATCEGFDVPVSSINPGRYDVVIKVSSAGKTGIIKGEVNI